MDRLFLKECLWLRLQENREPGGNPGRLRRCNGRRRPEKCHCPARVGKAGPEDDSEVRRPALSSLSRDLPVSSLECADQTVSPKTEWDARRPSVRTIIAQSRENRIGHYGNRILFVVREFRGRPCAFVTPIATRVVGAACKKLNKHQ